MPFEQLGVLRPMLRLDQVDHEVAPIADLPIWRMVSGLDGGGFSETKVRVGLAPQHSPSLIAVGSRLVSEPVSLVAGVYLTFAVSPSGGAGPDACESVFYPNHYMFSSGGTYFAEGDAKVVSNRLVNGCTQAEVILYGDYLDAYSGVGSGTEGLTWITYKLWRGNFEQNILPYGAACWKKNGGTGHMHCSVENGGPNSKYTLFRFHQGSWWGEPASIWRPLTIGQSYTIDGSALGEGGVTDQEPQVITA